MHGLTLKTGPNSCEPWTGQPINDILYPPNIGNLWRDAELAEIGLYRPVPAPPVPDHQTVVSESVDVVDGVPTVVHVLVDRPLAELKTELRLRMLAHADQVGAAITADYPRAEQQSWPVKQAEAAAIQAGATDPAQYPVIAAEAALSGMTVTEIAATVVAKASAFAAIAGMVAGFRRKGQAGIDAATTYAEAAAVLDAGIAELDTALSTLP